MKNSISYLPYIGRQKKYIFLAINSLFSSVLFAQPTIISFTPTSGPIGTSVTIIGTNFNTTAINNTVYFGAVKATVTAAISTSLTVTVPPEATFQPITVTSNGLTAFSNKPFLVTFSGGGAITTSSFSLAVNVPTTPIAPNPICISDLNNDGKVDIIAGTIGGVVSVYKNNSNSGNLSFASQVNFPAGNYHYNVATGDFDSDGKPDIVSANEGSSTVSVFKNTTIAGIISFATNADFPTSSSPRGVAASDIDGDGKPDLIVTSQYGHGISILKNTSTTGNISFAAKIDFVIASDCHPESVSIGDLDNDGKPDIAVANNNNPTGGSVSVFRNISSVGNISLASYIDLLTDDGSNPFIVNISDIDGDGKPDIVVNNQTINNTSIFRNTCIPGTISFDTKVNYTAAAGTRGLAVGDLDGDAKPEFAIPFNSMAMISVFRNTVDGPNITSFTPISASTGITVTLTGTNFTGAVNVSFGGTPAASFSVVNSTTIKALVGNGSSGTVSVITAVGTGTRAGFTYTGSGNPAPIITSFSPAKGKIGSVTTITGVNFSNVVAGNIVYFGAAKAVVSAATSTSLMVIVPGGSTHEPLTVTTNNLTAYSAAPFIVTFSGGGNFTPGSFASAVNFTTGSNPYGISIEDIDGDGRSDLVTANLSSDNFSLLRNTGSIGSLSFASKIDVATGIQPVNNATGDLDGDGKRDLIAANYGSNTISVFRNTSLSGTPSFSTKTDFATGINPLSVLIRDINGDGKPDMVVTNYSSNTFSVLANTSAGTGIISFAAKVDFNTGTQPAGMEIKDFDGDGKPDVAVSNYGSNSVSVFRNTSTGGSISFATKIDIVTGNNPNSVASCDFDGDGKFEIISANYSSNSISVFKNLSTSGAISFAAKVDYGTGSNPFKAVINDLNGDGLGDIVTANVFDATVSVLRNNGYGSSISFATSLQYATGSQPRSVGIADFDGDGEPDIAAGNYNDNTVSIVKNQIAVTLPLSLLDFTLTNKTNQIELYWKTANELNISLFTIEYSSDGLSFVKIGEVRSTHNTFSTNNYNFLHTNPDKGISYYRLKIMDIDGRFVYSKIIQAKLTAAAVQLLIFPNPSSEYIIVKHPLSPFESELQIVDMKGSVIKTIKVNKNVVQTEISTKKLPPGSYNIVWRCNETIISKKALVK